MSRSRGRALRTSAVVGAVGTAFAAGAMVSTTNHPEAVVPVTSAAGGTTGGLGPGPAGRPLDDAADRIAASALHPVDRAALNRAAVAGMLDALDDRWSAYYSAGDYAQFQDVLDGGYTGVGLWLRSDAAGRLVVASVAPASTAAAADVRVGDEVTDVAGRATRGRVAADVVAPLRGGAGSTVDVGIARGEARRVVTLTRERVTADDVVTDMPSPGVGRIRVATFARGVGARVQDALAGLRDRHVAGVVLDLRGDPGGLLTEAVQTTSAFVDGGLVVTYVRRDTGSRQLPAAGAGDVSTPLVVLVDGATASAAEVVAGALQDRGRAVLVGSRTYGKGSVQEPVPLGDGSAVELTVGRYLTPSGRSLDGIGLEPDVEVAAGSAPDVAVRRGLDVLSGLTAGSGLMVP
jgi:carboxyl-terminal processing protease